MDGPLSAAIPPFHLPHPSSPSWGQPSPHFEHNDSFDDKTSLSNLAQDRELYAENVESIDERLTLLKNQISILDAKKDHINSKIFAIDSVFHIIRRVPDDVMREIFLFCAPSPSFRDDEYVYPPSANVHDDWTQLMKAPQSLIEVCRRWRDLALGMPSLWTVLGINFNRNADISMVKLHVARARHYPLALRILAHENPDLWQDTLFIPLTCCRELQIDTVHMPTFSQITNKLAGITSLDLSMIGSNSWPPDDSPCMICHENVRLRTLSIREVTFIPRYYINVTQLVCLRITTLDLNRMDLFGALAEAARNLRYMTLGFSGDSFASDMGESKRIISFPRLESLHLVNPHVYDLSGGISCFHSDLVKELVNHFHLSALQFFTLHAGMMLHVGNVDTHLRLFRSASSDSTILFPTIKHVHVILESLGLTEQIHDLLCTVPQVTWLTVEENVLSVEDTWLSVEDTWLNDEGLRGFPGIAAMLDGGTLPLLETLKIDGFPSSKWEDFQCLIELFEKRKRGALRLPRLVLAFPLALQCRMKKEEEKGNDRESCLDRWLALEIDAREVTFWYWDDWDEECTLEIGVEMDMKGFVEESYTTWL